MSFYQKTPPKRNGLGGVFLATNRFFLAGKKIIYIHKRKFTTSKV